MHELLKKRKHLGSLLAFSAAGVCSCSHEVESPKVTVDHLEPDLICNEQLPDEGLSILIRGTGFTPMPFDTLQDKPDIELPQVDLVRNADLTGKKQDGPTITFPGKGDEDNASNLGWRTKELMSMLIDDDNAPEEGLYGIKVTNPDGKSAAEKDLALAVVSPPSVKRVIPTSLCNGLQDQRLNLEGENFLGVGEKMPVVSFELDGDVTEIEADRLDDCIEIEGLSEPVRLCESASVLIGGGELEEGDYEVSLINPAPAACSASESHTVKVLNEGPIVFFSDPPVVYNGINTRITLYMTSVQEPFTVAIVPAGEISPETELDATLVSGRDNRIQATVPNGTDPGEYDIIVNDDTGCRTVLDDGLVVTDDLSIEIANVVDPFGYSQSSTAVTIFGGGSSEFEATPRVFLNPPGEDEVAIQLGSVSMVNSDELNAIVPHGTAAGSYDLVVVNPSGEVGLLPGGFDSVDDPPPRVADVVPQSIVNQADQSIEVHGENFRDSELSLSCQAPNGSSAGAGSVNTGSVECTDGACTVSATIDGGSFERGTVCIVRITNSDGTYGEFSAIGITNSGLNLSEPIAGEPMLEARRALGSAAVKATAASRFVYAIGGDSGDEAAPLRSVEYSPVNVFGEMNPFVAATTRLGAARRAHAVTQIGRYIYAMGGTGTDGALDSGERALVLSPEESPVISDIDLCLSGGDEPCFGVDDLESGLERGTYSYRVSALIDSTDPQNLGGETLASDPISLKLPEISGRSILVELTWDAPLDSPGEELTGIRGWRIYRTPTDGVAGRDETLLAELDDPDLLSFIDDGSMALEERVPLLPGSTSAWQELPAMATPRTGLGAATARDPDDASTRYVYALLGEGESSYEFLPVTVLPNGRQTVGSAWEQGEEQSAVARSQFGAWTVDSVVSGLVSGTATYIYMGAGLADGNQDDRVEAALVTSGGQLDTFEDDPTAADKVGDFSSTRVGYGTAAAAGRLFVFGGLASQVRDNATAAEIISPAPSLANNAWNNEGLAMTTPRYLMGSSIQSAFIFLLGGQTDNSDATTSTEWVVW